MYGESLRLKYPKLYRFWANIKNLCNNSNNKMFCNYGGMGIKLYDGWNKYENFMKWAINNGWDDTKYINRINSKGNFEPLNCIVADKAIYNTKKFRNKNYNKRTNNRLYRIWQGIKTRCYNKNSKYKNYNGKGIIMCEEWRNSFTNFEIWARTNGYEDSLTIDRINNNGNYEPNNCRWVNNIIQQNNKNNNVLIEYNDKIYTIAELARKYNIDYKKLYARLCTYPLWSVERAISTP